MATLGSKRVQSVLLCSILCAVVLVAIPPAVLLTTRAASASTADGEALPPLDPYDYDRIRILREQLCLTNLDLAAMGCDQSQAEALLLALRRWHEANGAQLAVLEKQEALASAKVRATLRKIRIGPRNDALQQQLANLSEGAKQAKRATEAYKAGADAAIRGHLTESQLAVLEAARSNQDLPSRFRFVQALTQEQRKTLQGSSFVSNYGDSDLSSQQRNKLDMCLSIAASNMPLVITGEARVLPRQEVGVVVE